MPKRKPVPGPALESLERRAVLSVPGIDVSLSGNRVTLSLDPAGVAISNFSTSYDAANGTLTIVAENGGEITMRSPIDGISIHGAADAISVNLRTLARFAGISVVGGAGVDSITIGRAGVNLGAVTRGAVSQGLSIDTGAGTTDAITVAGPISAKGSAAVSLVTRGIPAAHGILLGAGVWTPWGSQTYAGAVTLLGDVAVRAGGDISFASTVDGSGRLSLAAGRSVTLAGDVGSLVPLQGVTLANAGRVTVGRGFSLDGTGTAVGASGLVVAANVPNVVFAASTADRTIGKFSGAGIRFVGGSQGSRITGVTSSGNGIGIQFGPGDYGRTVIAGCSFSGNSAAGVALAAARGVTIGGPGAGNSIVSNGGFGVTASGVCAGSLVAGNEIGGNSLGPVENLLSGVLVGGTVTQAATGVRFQLTEVGRAAFLAQRARTFAFDVSVTAFAVSARSSGRVDMRTGAVAVNASVGFDTLPPPASSATGSQAALLGTNRVVSGLTPSRTLPGIEFPRSVSLAGVDASGRHYRAALGLSTFAAILPLADLGGVPIAVDDGTPVTVDVWVNALGYVSRIVGSFDGGSFDVRLRAHGTTAAMTAPGGTPVGSAVPGGGAPAIGGFTAADAIPLLPGFVNGVSGIDVGHSTIAIPYGAGLDAPADWYFPTQSDGTVSAQGVIWLQHAFGTAGGRYAALAAQLARQTNSIVVVATLPSRAPAGQPGWWLPGDAMAGAVASLFDGDRSALKGSAVAAGFTGAQDALSGRFVLAGHSAGGGFATAVAAAYADGHADASSLLGVVMYDGVSAGAYDGSGAFSTQVTGLDVRGIPVFQIAAPAQLWNAYGATTNALLAARPGRFSGVVLVGGSHVDAMLGDDAQADAVAQRVTRVSPSGNPVAVQMLGAGWINDLFVGSTPETAQYGFYPSASQSIILGSAAAAALPSPIANTLSPGERRLDAEIDAIGGLFGFTPVPTINTGSNGLLAGMLPSLSNGVTGVRTGTAPLDIPCGTSGYETTADWYFPTQADGRVSANAVIWLQHGNRGDASAVATLAAAIAQATNSIVVAPTIRWFETVALPGGFLGGTALHEGVASMFFGTRGALQISAAAAGGFGPLPNTFLLAGQLTGGGFAAAVGACTVDNGAAMNLRGVVMIDGVSPADQFPMAVAKLDALGIPVYQIASPPQAGNDWGGATELLAALHPDQFIGVQLDDGRDLAAATTFATGWINDILSGVFGPTNPYYGIYGNPNDGTYVANVPITLGDVGATVLPAPPPVDLNQYAGLWYQQGSVKVPSVVLVNVTATYTPQPDGSIRVENAGNVSGPGGPAWSAIGSAVSVNACNTRLDVNYSGTPTTSEPGNYWILDYAPDYSWAIVGNPDGTSGTILTRDSVITDSEYDALVARAHRLGVRGTFTRTAQFPIVPP